MAVSFYNRLWMAYQLPVGPWPLFGEKETTAVAFTGFCNPGSLERKKSPFFFSFKQKSVKSPCLEQLQINTTSRPFSLFLTPTHYLFLSVSNKHAHTVNLIWEWGKHTGSAPSFTCLIISGDEGYSQNSLQLFCLWAACLPLVHLLTELLNESRAGMLIKESGMLLEIWHSASRWASQTGGFVSVEQI